VYESREEKRLERSWLTSQKVSKPDTTQLLPGRLTTNGGHHILNVFHQRLLILFAWNRLSALADLGRNWLTAFSDGAIACVAMASAVKEVSVSIEIL
jgi:hypothetical protein